MFVNFSIFLYSEKECCQVPIKPGSGCPGRDGTEPGISFHISIFND